MEFRLKSRIADLRRNSGLTQAQLAVLIGVTTNTVQNWEKDSGLAQLEKYLKLCEIFECDIWDLVEYVETSEKEETVPVPKEFSIGQVHQIKRLLVKEIRHQKIRQPKQGRIRRRGVMLTQQGFEKLKNAIAKAEYRENRGNRFTLEALSERTTLAVDTIMKVFVAEAGVDKRTLKHLFEAFNLILEPEDYQFPSYLDLMYLKKKISSSKIPFQ